MADFKVKHIPLTGKVVTSRSPTVIGDNNYSILTNLRPTKVHPKGISGMTKINTTALTSYPIIKSCKHFLKDSPAETHFLVQAYNSGGTESKIYDNTTAIPNQGNFSSTVLLTEANGTTKGNWAKSPGGNVAYCNNNGSYVWGGTESVADACLNIDGTGSTFTYDYSNQIRNTLSDASNIATLYRSSSGGHTYTYIEIGSTRPIKGIKPYILTANTAAATMAVQYYASGAWSAVSSLVDGTAVAGKTMAQTGWVTFTSTDGIARPSLLHDRVLYWYRVILTDVDNLVVIYYLTIDKPFQSIKDVWDGIPRNCYSFVWGTSASTYQDFTANIYSDNYDSDNSDTYAGLGLMTTDRHMYFGFTERMMGIDVYFGGTYKNSASATATIYYWNGASWVSVGTLTDNTSVGGITWNKSAHISWQPPLEYLEHKTEVVRPYLLYYYKITFSAQLTSDIRLQYVTGIPAPKTINTYSFPLQAGNSLWLLSEVDDKKNKIIKSFPGSVDVFNGTEAKEFYIGDDTAVIAGATIYMQLGSSLYEAVVVCKKTETWMIVPNTGANGSITYSQFLVDGSRGCVAQGTMDRIAIGSFDKPELSKNIVIWQGASAIYMFDGKSVMSVSDDISDWFDRTKSYCINSAMLDKSEGFFDELNHYHWLFASGSATALDTEWVLDTERMEWYRIDRGTGKYLQCGDICTASIGNRYSYGAIITGYIERLENGTDFDGTAITHILQLAALIPGNDKYGSGLDNETIIRNIRLVCSATNITANTISISYYGDESTTAVNKTLSLIPQKAGRTIAISGQMAGEEYFTFHKIKFTMITNDETVGFEPILLSLFYQDKRQFLGER